MGYVPPPQHRPTLAQPVSTRRANWIFEGLPEIIGNFGLIDRGAVGVGVDCLSPDLGGPPSMLRLMFLDDHSAMRMLVNKEFGVAPPNLGGDADRESTPISLSARPARAAPFWRFPLSPGAVHSPAAATMTTSSAARRTRQSDF